MIFIIIVGEIPSDSIDINSLSSESFDNAIVIDTKNTIGIVKYKIVGKKYEYIVRSSIKSICNIADFDEILIRKIIDTMTNIVENILKNIFPKFFKR
jgi:hypothetical protein